MGIRLGSLAAVLICIMVTTSDSGQTDDALYEVDTGQLQKLMKASAKKDKIPGLVAGVVAGGELQHVVTVGQLRSDSDAPVTEASRFQIASVTKLFTASLLVAMSEAGEVGLHDTLADHLPAELVARLDPDMAAITLYQLAAHTSGLPREAVNRRNVPNSPSVALPYSTTELYEGLAETELWQPPGTGVHYSNLATGLLGHVLERAGGKDLETLMRARLLGPLGMADSAVLRAGDSTDDMAGHHWPSDPARQVRAPWRFGDIWGHGGLSSTVPDLAAFLAMQSGFAAESPLSQEALARMQRPAVMEDREWRTGFAIGWQVMPHKALGEILYHDGDADGHSAYVALNPTTGVGLIVLANIGGVADEVGEDLLDVVFAEAKVRLASYVEAVSSGEPERIVEGSAPLLALNPRNMRAAYFKGRSLILLGHCADGLALFDQGGLQGVYKAYGLYYHAACAAQAGDFDRAEATLMRAVRLGFNDADRVLHDDLMAPLKGRTVYDAFIEKYAH